MSTCAGRARRILVGARHQPLPAARHRGAVVPPGARRLPRPQQRARPALRLRAARVAGAAGAGESGSPAGSSGRSMATRCGPPPRTCSASTTSRRSAVRRARPPSPVKRLNAIAITRHGAYWRFDFDGVAFLHHMVRNIMGCLVAVGAGQRAPAWVADVLAARDRDAAAPTFAADGLYFAGPYYDAAHGHLPSTRRPSTGCLLGVGTRR